MSWITIVGFFALLIIKLAWDWYAKNKNGRIISHGKSALYDFAIYIPLVYFPNGYTDFENVLIGLATLLMARGVFFDPLFNLLNGDGFFHLGNSAMLDRLGDKVDGKKDNKGVVYFFLRLICLLSMVFYIYKYV